MCWHFCRKRFLMIEMFEESGMKTDTIEKNLLFKHQRKDETIQYNVILSLCYKYMQNFISLQVCTFLLLLLHSSQKKGSGR